jgi:transposase
LLLRFQNDHSDVLRFLTQPDVPFTNHQAERDLRMMKSKQKISGGFRSFDFAVSFAYIRSFLSTASKHGLNLLEILTDALQGNVSVFLSSTTTTSAVTKNQSIYNLIRI